MGYVRSVAGGMNARKYHLDAPCVHLFFVCKHLLFRHQRHENIRLDPRRSGRIRKVVFSPFTASGEWTRQGETIPRSSVCLKLSLNSLLHAEAQSRFTESLCLNLKTKPWPQTVEPYNVCTSSNSRGPKTHSL